MPIAIIGTGNVGGGIARGRTGKGHALVLGARDPQAAKVLALASDAGATAMTPEAAAAAGDVVILALPWAAEGTIRALRPMAGKTVIDGVNLLGMVEGALGLTVGHTPSGGEIVPGLRRTVTRRWSGTSPRPTAAGPSAAPAGRGWPRRSPPPGAGSSRPGRSRAPRASASSATCGPGQSPTGMTCLTSKPERSRQPRTCRPARCHETVIGRGLMIPLFRKYGT